ncbi:MAG TPA: arginase family protein [Glaciibacter sp.]|nr:arginase family protein [Glaciibacter sp.]
MSVSFVVVPQWQGSVSPRAMRLIDGAEAIRGDLPASRTRVVDVPAEAGDGQDTGISRFSTLAMVRERLAHTLRELVDETPEAEPGWALTIGGDCGVSLAAVGHAAAQNSGKMAVVWFDAHPDLHTAETSASGGFSGMVLRAITGDGHDQLALADDAAVPFDRVILAGIRDVDPPEDEVMEQRGIRSLFAEDLEASDGLVGAIRDTGATCVYVHIDLDVLDPAVLMGLSNPLPFGLSVEALTGAITALRAEFPIAGATIAGFAPASPEAANDDLPSILRIIGALTR